MRIAGENLQCAHGTEGAVDEEGEGVGLDGAGVAGLGSAGGLAADGRTVTVTCSGSRAAISFSMAMMEAYWVPWAPEISARTLPGLVPFTTTTGMFVAGSTPAGTSR